MITILTPTYNREKTLPRLFQSLMEQSSYDFEWLVIDDGSCDGSEKLVSGYRKLAPFQVRYIKKFNGGKHTALNIGFKESEREWIFVVDSDDWLQNDCIEKISNHVQVIPENFHSLSILRQNEKGDVIGDCFTDGLSNYLDRVYANIKGDKGDVFRKSALTGFSFPEYPGENFMAESPLFIWLGKFGNTKFINYPGYICEYQPGGLSDMSVRNRLRCINSTLYVYEKQYELLDRFLLKSKAAINWWRFRLKNPLIKTSYRPPIIYLPFGLLLCLNDRFKTGIVKK